MRQIAQNSSFMHNLFKLWSVYSLCTQILVSKGVKTNQFIVYIYIVTKSLELSFYVF